MKITVAGAGYVGLSLAILLAQHNEVTIVDVVDEKVKLINQKISPIKDEYIEKYLEEKQLNLVATKDARKAYKDADFVIVATPTNYDADKEFFDTSSVERVLNTVVAVNKSATIIIKSTIPVGFTNRVRKALKTDKIIFSPEFLRESKALYDNLYPSRIIVSCDEKSRKSAEQFAELLQQGAIKENVDTFFMGFTEAEAVKLFSNTYLALRVAYFNELDTYAETMGLNAKDIITAVCHDPRIGDYYNNPSFGYGGYCLPKDTKQLRANFKGISENLISAVCESNHTRKDYIAHEVLSKNPNVVGIYRLIMKSDSDNFRSSAVRGIIRRLQAQNKSIIIFEPTLADKSFMECPIINDIDEFIKMSDVIVANRLAKELEPVIDKVYTRDIFYRD
ncbi:MAG: nucleotide sugar dehydrogenase [Agathobacter sp.]|nr:nucleotide sugar dehydrogenase [Agathobacter sp.]